MNRIIIALGSNHNQQENILKAQGLLRSMLDCEINFTESLQTEPVGIVSPLFLNCLGFARTSLLQAETVALLKRIECLCGNTSDSRKRNIIEMDIDLLLFGEVKLHADDWQRDYIKTLMRSSEVNVPKNCKTLL